MNRMLADDDSNRLVLHPCNGGVWMDPHGNDSICTMIVILNVCSSNILLVDLLPSVAR